jgi:hypothetical protein
MDNQPQEQDQSPQSGDKSKYKVKGKSQNYLKYSSWGYTLFGLMLIAILVGQWVDKRYEFENPVVTLSLLTIVIVTKFYKLIRDLA